jgi:hypothetical protein
VKNIPVEIGVEVGGELAASAKVGVRVIGPAGRMSDRASAVVIIVLILAIMGMIFLSPRESDRRLTLSYAKG